PSAEAKKHCVRRSGDKRAVVLIILTTTKWLVVRRLGLDTGLSSPPRRRVAVDRRLPNPLLLAGINLLILLQTSWAHAAPKDAAATKLDNDAIYTDYLAMKFGDAEKKLKQALTLCGKGAACSPKVVATLHRDL